MIRTTLLLPFLLAGCTVSGVRNADKPPSETIQVLENGIGIRR